MLVGALQRMVHVGLFLGYSIDVGEHFDGEGIGRFIIRLTDGLLRCNRALVLHVTTTERNYQVVEQALQRNLSSMNRTRMVHHKFSTVEWVNQHVEVCGWIVPYIGMEMAVGLERPFIVSLHDLVYLHFPDVYDKAHPGFFEPFGRVVDAVTSRASKVVFHSDFTRNHEGMVFLQTPPSKAHVIRLAAPIEEYRSFGVSVEDVFRNHYGLFQPYIVYPSMIRLHKNHVRLIQAFLNFRQSAVGSKSNLKLVLTDCLQNRPQHDEISQLLADCRSESDRNSVVFLGRVAAQDLPSLYKYSVGTIIPTLFEGGFPFQVLESVVMNTPAAVSRIEVIRESLPNLDAFMAFDPYSLEELESAISNLWKLGGSLVPAQQAATRHLLKRTWTQVAADYCQLLMSTVSESQ
ncbi:glycosyltransferase [Alicyclobacillus sp. ALC3]|uniref:glycosyltransferase n=1 Tax=Alicyclobacillus sp. ALC3 TaxID=2796143 RepID=UPI0023790776|nr:glycosyltransferase [Alicyclobacillus sp. ALC3]WDL95156.1 glycosyltransferase [Alicyclobacillus sp. ALC3]